MNETPQRSQVSGHYAGPITRLVGFIIDIPIVGLIFGLMAAGVIFAVNLVAEWDPDSQGESGLAWAAALIFWSFVYQWVSLSIAGRTPGRALAGVRIVEVQGGPLSARSAFVRVVVFPFSFLLFGAGFIPMVFGKPRRALHDYAAHSAVVYDWGDRPAELSTPLSNWLQRSGIDEADPVDLRG